MHLQEMRDLLHRELQKEVGELLLNGPEEDRLPNTLNVSIPEVLGHKLCECLKDVAVSAGSACHAGEAAPSQVLLAMGMPAEQALCAIRLSVGRSTTSDQIKRAVKALGESVRMCRG